MFRPRLGRTLLGSAPWRPAYSTASRRSDPLRILFCGSDRFSCASLQALHDEQKRNSALIRSIDVVVRPSKPTGRGNKVLKEVPIRSLAQQLKFPIHVRDTFTGWDMPIRRNGEPINLIIAVSFGLFVPPRLIHASKYGGLNVHPSLLPDLRGPAPIHHALLAGRTHTGITIQTLSPEAFDEGAILLQTPSPGLFIPKDCTVEQLHDLLAPIGASKLVEALRRGLHVPPYDTPPATTTTSSHGHNGQTGIVPPTTLQHAPKITTLDHQVRWFDASSSSSDRTDNKNTNNNNNNNNKPHTSAAAATALRARVLGPLWSHIQPPPTTPPRPGSPWASSKPRRVRVILEDVSTLSGFPRPSERTGSSALLLEDGAAGDVRRAFDLGEAEEGVVRWQQLQQQPRAPALAAPHDGNSDDGGGDTWQTWEGRYTVDPDGEAVRVRMPDGSWVRIGRIKVEGSTSKAARRVLRRLGRCG